MPYRDEMVSAMLEELFDDTLLNQVYGKITEGNVGEGMSGLVSGMTLRTVGPRSLCEMDQALTGCPSAFGVIACGPVSS